MSFSPEGPRTSPETAWGACTSAVTWVFRDTAGFPQGHLDAEATCQALCTKEKPPWGEMSNKHLPRRNMPARTRERPRLFLLEGQDHKAGFSSGTVQHHEDRNHLQSVSGCKGVRKKPAAST